MKENKLALSKQLAAASTKLTASSGQGQQHMKIEIDKFLATEKIRNAISSRKIDHKNYKVKEKVIYRR